MTPEFGATWLVMTLAFLVLAGAVSAETFSNLPGLAGYLIGAGGVSFLICKYVMMPSYSKNKK